MKKFIGLLMVAAVIASCNSSSSTESKGEQAADTTTIRPTNPATENDAATHSQPIPGDSVDYAADSIVDKKDSATPR
jgi:hypothetical protein